MMLGYDPGWCYRTLFHAFPAYSRADTPRLFPHLPAWEPDGSTEHARRANLERLAATVVQQESTRPEATGDNIAMPAAYTYFSHMVQHDLIPHPDCVALPSPDYPRRPLGCTARLSLHGLYGGGPGVHPFMYDQTRRTHDDCPGYLLLGKGEYAAEDDVPRNAQGQALIADWRDDYHIVLSQLHLAFRKFHNRVLQDLDAQRLPGAQAFVEAQRIVRWHYQWVVVHDFLPRFVGHERVATFLQSSASRQPFNTCSSYRFPRLPVEFTAVGWARYSMTRPAYILSDVLEAIRTQTGEAGAVPCLLESHEPAASRHDLRGGKILPRFWTVQWNRFLTFENDLDTPPEPQLSRRINTTFANQPSTPFLYPDTPDTLARYLLLHSWHLGLPSGQQVARAMGLVPIYHAEQHDPFWLYILHEAALGGGTHLGPVGGSIVANVILSLLASDPQSFFTVDPAWTPQHERHVRIVPAGAPDLQLRDILRFARAPLSRDDIDAMMSPG